jgi:hypothetical protein
MRLLLDNIMTPITREVGFLESNCERVVEEFLSWLAPVQRKRGIKLGTRYIHNGLISAFSELLPLTTVEARRFLFIQTSSQWTAYFDNGYLGTDVFSAVSYLAQQLNCRGVRVGLWTKSADTQMISSMNEVSAVLFDVYGPNTTSFLNYERSISNVYDNGRWQFNHWGTPFAFEDVSRYQHRSPKQRFTTDMLQSYTTAFNISPFEDNFYVINGMTHAVMVEKIGPLAQGVRQFTLHEAQKSLRLRA